VIWQYAFVHNALLAGAIVAVVSGLVGPFVVMRHMSFAVHGVAELGFTGAAGALLVGLSPSVGLLAFSLAASAVMGALGEQARERDVAIGATLSFGLGLGVLFISLYSGYAQEAFALLFGTILGISTNDVVLAVVVGAVTIILLLLVHRPLRFASVDPEVAEARGISLGLMSMVFAATLAFAVVEAVQVVGVLLLLTLVITPAAAAQHLTSRPGRVMVISVAIALVSALGGIVLGLFIAWPVSFFVSAISFAAYLGARLVGASLRRTHATL